MRNKLLSIILCTVMLIGTSLPASACSREQVESIAAKWEQYCGKFWRNQTPKSEESEPEPEEDNPASHLIIGSVESLENTIEIMNNLYRPTWGKPDED